MSDESSQADRLDGSSPEAAVAAFMASLRAVTPRLWAIPAIVAANVAVFAAMIAAGVDALAPGAVAVLPWGANYGPKTLAGEPWRLATSMFVHFGAIHLLANMLALAHAGRVVERIFGHARFAAVYLAAGLCGSVASVAVHPQVASAGASGAVFGVYGALGGFLLRRRGAIPGPVLSRLGGIAASFIAYNVLYGFTRPNVDVSAHVGGVLAGAIVGAYLAPPLVAGRKSGAGRVALVSAACAALVGVAYGLLPPFGRVRLSTHPLPGFSIDLPPGEIVSEGTEYAGGKLMLKASAGHTTIAVAWLAGTGSRSVFEATATGLASTIGATRPDRFTTSQAPDGAAVETTELHSASARVRMSTRPCGRRAILLVTIGDPPADVLHDRMLRTIACRPDPRAEVAEIGVVPLNLTLPGWSAIDRSDGQVLLSDGRSMLLLRPGWAASIRKLGDAIGPTLNAIGGAVTITSSGPDAATLTGTFQGDHVDGWARVLRCRRGGVLVVLLAPDPETSERVGALTSSARCTEEGEPPSTWPDAASAGTTR